MALLTREDIHKAVHARGVPALMNGEDVTKSIDEMLDGYFEHYVRGSDQEKVWLDSAVSTITLRLRNELSKQPWYLIQQLHTLEGSVTSRPSKNAVAEARRLVRAYFDANLIEMRSPEQIGS